MSVVLLEMKIKSYMNPFYIYLEPLTVKKIINVIFVAFIKSISNLI